MPEEQLGQEAKRCLDYWFAKHKAEPPAGRGFEPIVCGGRDMKLFKTILHVYEIDTVKKVIDLFFSTNGRADFGTRALFNRFDTLFGVLKDKAEGRR